MAVTRRNYYDTEGLPVAGLVSLAKNQNLFTAVQSLGFLKFFALARGYFSLPTAAIDGGNDKVDLTAIDALLDGYNLQGTGSWQFAAQATDTYYLQVQNDGTLSAAAAEDTDYLTVGTVDWDLPTTTLSNLTITATVGMSWTGGTGDVSGPGSSTDHNLPWFDGTGGKTLEDSGITGANVVSAVALKHAQLHDVTDHTSLAENAAGHSGLDFAYKAGTIRKDNAVVSVIAGAVTLADDTTNYVEIDNTGSVTANATSFTAGKLPLFEVVTASGAIDTVTDKRAWLTIGPTGAGSGDVTGPGSSTDGYIVIFDGVTGKAIKMLALAGSAVVTAVNTASDLSVLDDPTLLAALGDVTAALIDHPAEDIDTETPHGIDPTEVRWYASHFLTRELDTAAPAVGQVYAWDGAKWTATTIVASLDIAGMTEETTADYVNDFAVLYSDANGAERKMTLPNFLKPHTDAADPHTGYMLESAVVTSIGTPGSDTAWPSEQAVREALPVVASAAEVNTGTENGKWISPDAFAGSNPGIRYLQITCFDYTTDVATGDGKGYLVIPSGLNGMNLVSVHARVITAGTTGTTDIQIANVTDTVDMLSTKLTIDSGETGSETAATAAVIDTDHDDIATNDLLRIDVDAKSTTAPKGLIVTLGFQLP